jgi:hypothetical protein
MGLYTETFVEEAYKPKIELLHWSSFGATGFTCKDCLFCDELPHFSFRGWFKIPLTVTMAYTIDAERRKRSTIAISKLAL